jgi:hypothetical protein
MPATPIASEPIARQEPRLGFSMNAPPFCKETYPVIIGIAFFAIKISAAFIQQPKELSISLVVIVLSAGHTQKSL